MKLYDVILPEKYTFPCIAYSRALSFEIQQMHVAKYTKYVVSEKTQRIKEARCKYVTRWHYSFLHPKMKQIIDKVDPGDVLQINKLNGLD